MNVQGTSSKTSIPDPKFLNATVIPTFLAHSCNANHQGKYIASYTEVTEKYDCVIPSVTPDFLGFLLKRRITSLYSLSVAHTNVTTRL
jgi:hypothetical protein